MNGNKYLEFKLVGHKPRTEIWHVLSKRHGNRLGVIQWYAPWRQYCFYPEADCVFNNRCLQKITEFLEHLMIRYRIKRKTRKIKERRSSAKLRESLDTGGKSGFEA